MFAQQKEELRQEVQGERIVTGQVNSLRNTDIYGKRKMYKLRCERNRFFFWLKYRNRSEETCEHLDFRGYLKGHVGETQQN